MNPPNKSGDESDKSYDKSDDKNDESDKSNKGDDEDDKVRTWGSDPYQGGIHLKGGSISRRGFIWTSTVVGVATR